MSLLDNIQLDNDDKEVVDNPLLRALKAKQKEKIKPAAKKDSPKEGEAEFKDLDGEEREEAIKRLEEVRAVVDETLKKRDNLKEAKDTNEKVQDTATKLLEDIENEAVEEVKDKPKDEDQPKEPEENKKKELKKEKKDKEDEKEKEDKKKPKEEKKGKEENKDDEKDSKDIKENAEPKETDGVIRIIKKLNSIRSNTETKKEEDKAKDKETKSKPKKENKKEPEKVEYISMGDLPKTEVSFGEAVSKISPDLDDPEWNKFVQEIEEEKKKLLLPIDMTTADMSMILSNASNLRLKLSNPFAEYKNLYDTLASKETDGLIRIIKKLNSIGSNIDEREMSGINACIDHDNINLYELLSVVRRRFYYIKESYDFVKDISSLMITSNGNLKLQQTQGIASNDKFD